MRIELSEPLGTLCVEHMLVGSAFQDYYEFYMASGVKSIRLVFSEPAHRAEVLANGLRVFAFCGGGSVLSAVLQTARLYMGGIA